MGQVKSIFFYFNRDALGTLITDLNKQQFQPNEGDEMLIVKNTYEFYGKFRKMLIIVTWLAVVPVLIKPLFSKSKYMLPCPAIYPINIYYSPVFEIIYGHQVIALIYFSLNNLYTNVTFIGLLTFIGIQCDLLCHRLKKLSCKKEAIQKDWIQNIRHYKSILRYFFTPLI
nr:odorant receptor 36 [Pachyrhinus yasumatsui]